MATNEDSTSNELHRPPAANIEDVRVESEMEQSYIDYAMSVIVGRALPDVRDGLKPVQRRVLYAMSEAGVTSNSGHRKSSSVVGETMGNYHPHGDSSIYSALVRMAQPFSLRQPLIDGQGNFGSIDDDPPAAMRYTEARLSPIGESLLEDIDRDTVDFESNYDDRLEEPAVLPAKFPNLLVNGSSGIAVGMSTEVPPHNLGEVIDATIHLIDNTDCTIEDLMEHIPGPDFPTGATIVGREGILNAYKTGRGRLRVRADYHVEEQDSGGDRIVVTEVPYQTNKSRLVERIADMVKDDRLEGVSDLRDESDRDGIRVVIDLKRGAITDVVENQLIDEVLEKTFSVLNLAIVDGTPQVMTLKETLGHYIDHRKEVVRRRSEYELQEKEDRAHILEGRLKALDHAESIVEDIQDAEDRTEAIEVLSEEYDFSEAQATHVTRMQLGSLTSMEAGEVKDEYEQVTARIERLEEILENESELLGVIKRELREVKGNYDNERRTDIVSATDTVTREDLIPEEDLVVVLTDEGYIKRMPAADFDTQQRAGKGVIGTNLKDGDTVERVAAVNTHDRLLCVTNKGNVHERKGYQLPDYGRTARGTADVNVFDGFEDGEHVTAIVPASDDDFTSDHYLTFVTANGSIKRTSMAEFDNILSTGIRAIGLPDEDRVVEAAITTDDDEVFIGTSDGRAIRFPLSDVRPTGRSAQGVNAIKLDENTVTGFVAIEPDDDRDVLTLTENGYGKRTALDEYSSQSRYGKGVIDIKTAERNGDSVAVFAVTEDTDLFIMSEDGQIIRTSADEVSKYGRNTNGVTVMDFDDGDRVGDTAVRQ